MNQPSLFTQRAHLTRSLEKSWQLEENQKLLKWFCFPVVNIRDEAPSRQQALHLHRATNKHRGSKPPASRDSLEPFPWQHCWGERWGPPRALNEASALVSTRVCVDALYFFIAITLSFAPLCPSESETSWKRQNQINSNSPTTLPTECHP